MFKRILCRPNWFCDDSYIHSVSHQTAIRFERITKPLWKHCIFIIAILLFTPVLSHAQSGVKVMSIKGDVKVRMGLAENWQVARRGLMLKDIDSILTGKKGTVKLQLPSGTSFELNPQAMLDISDLRNISEKELFLWMMSNKIKNLDIKSPKQPLRIGNVSVVHGESKATRILKSDNDLKEFAVYEKNGAKALYHYKMYPNTVMKLHRLLEAYPSEQKCGEIHYLLGKSFAALHQDGQAIDSFQKALTLQKQDACGAARWLADARSSLEALKAKVQ